MKKLLVLALTLTMVAGSVSVHAANTDPDLINDFTAEVFELNNEDDLAVLMELYVELEEKERFTGAYEAAFSGLTTGQQERAEALDITLDAIADLADFIKVGDFADEFISDIEGDDETGMLELLDSREAEFRDLMDPYAMDDISAGFDRMDKIFSYLHAFEATKYTMLTVSSTDEMTVNEEDVIDAVNLANEFLVNDIESTTELIAGLNDFAAFYNTDATADDKTKIKAYLQQYDLVEVSTSNKDKIKTTEPIEVTEPEVVEELDTVTVEAEVEDGVASSVIDDDIMDEAVDNVSDDEEAERIAIFEMEYDSESVDTIQFEIPLDTVKEFEDDEDIRLDAVTVKSNIGTVTFDTEAIMGNDNKGEANEIEEDTTLSVEMKLVNPDTLDDVPAGATVVDFSVILTDDKGKETEVDRFAKPIEVSVPYTPEEGEYLEFITVFYVNDDGESVPVGGKYNEETGMVDFMIEHFSMFYAAQSMKTFEDVPEGHWAFNYITGFAGKGFINGVGEDQFNPSDTITRAQFVSIVTRMYRLTGDPTAIPFTDVTEGAWYEGAVAAAFEAGIINGLSATTFGPHEKITRQQAAVIIKNVMALNGFKVESDHAVISNKFVDYNTIAQWAADSVAAVYKVGIVGGKPGNAFDPKGNTTRAEATKMLSELYNVR